ncbi:MAG: hypothetical protein WBG42_13155 [Cryomorphaceae bacterium]
MKFICSEIEEEAYFKICGFQVIEDLGGMNTMDFAHRFYFYNYGLKADKVGAVSFSELMIFVTDGQWFFIKERDLSEMELYRQRFVINGLKKTGAELSMNFHR